MSNRLVTRLSDRLLARIVPNTTAAAAHWCQSGTFTQYTCVEHLKYRRTCYRYNDCTYDCGGWVSYTHC